MRGRNSDNRLISEKLGWVPSRPLREGLERTYRWIEQRVRSNASHALGQDSVPMGWALPKGIEVPHLRC